VSERDPPAGREPEDPDREAEAHATLAQVSFLYFRRRRLASLRRLALASLPVWVQASWPVIPPLLTWLALLVEAYFFVEVATYAALEHLWAHRRRAFPREHPVAIHLVWMPWEALISSLWYLVGLVSLVPWVSVAGGRALSLWLGPALARLAAVTALLVLLALGAGRFQA
jgi:hypothetical protein